MTKKDFFIALLRVSILGGTLAGLFAGYIIIPGVVFTLRILGAI